MTAPRQVLPKRTSMLSRRCTQRLFLLRPDAETNAIFEYCLADASRRTGVGVIAWLLMSNHYHAIVYDPEGRLPEFTEHLHKMLAKVLNVRWGRSENLWSSEETCVTHLATAEDIFRKVLYLLANPLTADLVDRLTDWPGSSSFLRPTGRRTVHRRPRIFFRANGTMPEQVELQTMLPPEILANETAESWEARVRAALEEEEKAARERRIRAGKRVAGRKAVLRASPFDAPSTIEAPSTLRPSLAAADREKRIEELRDLRAFRVAHEAARLRFVQGERDVIFPPGTYRMRRWGARCADSVPLAA